MGQLNRPSPSFSSLTAAILISTAAAALETMKEITLLCPPMMTRTENDCA